MLKYLNAVQRSIRCWLVAGWQWHFVSKLIQSERRHPRGLGVVS
jgi:hypothetical protein